MTTNEVREQNSITWIKEPSFLARLSEVIRTDVNPVTLASIAALTCQKQPKLLRCTRFSLACAIIECVQLGLEPNDTSGQAYIIPYKETATLVIGYRGMIQLGYRFGGAKLITTRNVYANERCNYDTCEHSPLPPKDRGDWIASYAKIHLMTGGVLTELMWAEEINAIAEAAIKQSRGKTPWVAEPNDDVQVAVGEMRRKTPMRRAFKYLASTPTLQRAVTIDEMSETGEPQFVEPPMTEGEMRNQYSIRETTDEKC
jgi:recombination protein RecT